MGKQRKSPQEKKELEYARDHFTFGWHSSREFPKGWKRKKQHTNRAYRRKSQLLLTQVKPETEAQEAESLSDDMTATRFRSGLSRKRLQKTGTVNLGEKVKSKLEKRERFAGRKSRLHQHYDREAAAAMSTLKMLSGQPLTDFVRVVTLDRNRLRQHVEDPLEQAMSFVSGLAAGCARERDAVDRNPELARQWRIWLSKAQRILEKERKAAVTKAEEKKAARARAKLLATEKRPAK